MSYKLNKPNGNIIMVQRKGEWQQFRKHPSPNEAAIHLRALVAKASAAISKPKVKKNRNG